MKFGKSTLTNAAKNFGGVDANTAIMAKDKMWDANGGFEGLRKKAESASGLKTSPVEDITGNIGGFFDGTRPVDSSFRGDQAQLIQGLQARLNGQQPSMANLNANMQRDAGLNNLMAMRASNRGGNPALAARAQQMAAGNMNSQIHQQAQVGNLQEQLNNQNMLAQALQQARGQDQAFQQLDQQNMLARAGAQSQGALNAQGLNNANTQQNNELRWRVLNKQFESGDKLIGGIGTMMGGAGSDERMKHDVEEIKDKDLNEFFTAIKPKKYKYNEPEKPGRQPGERLGFMLQDIQDTKLGKKMISKDENGLMFYDKDNLQGILIAELSRRAKKGE